MVYHGQGAAASLRRRGSPQKKGRSMLGRLMLIALSWLSIARGAYIPCKDDDTPPSNTLPSFFVHNLLKDGRTVELKRENLDYRVDSRNLQIVSPGGGSGQKEYGRIRIEFDTRPIEAQRGQNDDQDAVIDRIIAEILPAARTMWEQHLMVPRTQTGITVRTDSCFGEFESVLQQDVHFPDADLVVLVSGQTSGLCSMDGPLAAAGPCAIDQADRPYLGRIVFCLNAAGVSEVETATASLGLSIQDQYSSWTGVTFRSEHLRVSLLATTIHELTHVLGMIDFLFSYFRDERGRPLTPRDSSGKPQLTYGDCYDGSSEIGVFPSNNTVQLIPKENGGRFDQYLLTPHVQQIARNHFNCQTLLGARLAEDPGCRGTHWHERHYFSHLLSPYVNPGSSESLSLLTLALLEDTGWYRVNYNGGAHPAFGLLAGCGFVEEDCIQNQTSPKWNEGEFCTAPLLARSQGGGVSLDSLRHVFCDAEHDSWNVCDLAEYLPSKPPTKSYFGDRNLAPFFRAADECPIPRIGLGLNCRIEDEYTPFYSGETVGPSSRCVNARFGSGEGGTSFQPACVRVTCDAEAREVRIGQGNDEYICKSDGEEIEVPLVSGESGIFICPRLAALCPDLYMCRNSCHGRGICVYDGLSLPPKCSCFEGNEDNDCAPSYANEFDDPPSAPSGLPTLRPTSTQGLTSVPTSGPQSAQDSSGVASFCKRHLIFCAFLAMAACRFWD